MDLTARKARVHFLVFFFNSDYTKSKSLLICPFNNSERTKSKGLGDNCCKKNGIKSKKVGVKKVKKDDSESP